MKMKRVFLIVLDSVGIGEEPDAAQFGDAGANTMRSISKSPKFAVPNLIKMGLADIDGVDYLIKSEMHSAAVARLQEVSMGKDTTVGHWEIAGIISEKPLPTFTDGFPDAIISEFVKQTGRGVLCNRAYSGTDVIRDYGEEHVKTGKLIVYTSADSVFQIAAHEDIIPCEELYRYCRIARNILSGEYGVGRVIARPFTGKAGHFTRTANRHDFSLMPPEDTMLDAIRKAGLDTIAVGKISDIFAGKGISESILTHGNSEGMEIAARLAERNFRGLCFVNLVDYDMLYGHRQDVDGYANALTEFDSWLPSFVGKLGDGDMLMITADHGCDPADKSTDHTREYIPLIIYGKGIRPVNLGTARCFAHIAATVTDALGVDFKCEGRSFMPDII